MVEYRSSVYAYVHFKDHLVPVGQWGDDQSPRVSQVLISIVEEGVCLSNSTVIILLQSTYVSHNAVERCES